MPITARLYNFAEAENDGKTILQGTQNICKMNCVQESGEKYIVAEVESRYLAFTAIICDNFPLLREYVIFVVFSVRFRFQSLLRIKF